MMEIPAETAAGSRFIVCIGPAGSPDKSKHVCAYLYNLNKEFCEYFVNMWIDFSFVFL